MLNISENNTLTAKKKNTELQPGVLWDDRSMSRRYSVHKNKYIVPRLFLDCNMKSVSRKDNKHRLFLKM